MSGPTGSMRRRSLLAALTAGLPTVAWMPPARAAAAVATPEPVRIALIEGLSGAFANAGEAVYRNLLWAVERVNARGGVRAGAAGVRRPLLLQRMDSKGSTEEALLQLRAAVDQGVRIICQGNSSATALALVDAVNRHNERDPARRVLFLNYSAVEPSLTAERCSFWHFRFDADADMRLAALVAVMKADTRLRKVYLIGQDYSFGQYVLRQARVLIRQARPDVEIVGEELHPLGRIKDFLPYAAKIRASGADAVLTGNWGNDLTLLVKSARDLGLKPKFYTFYGNALGVPATLGEAGVGSVLAVSEWHPNVGDAASDALVRSFRQRFPDPKDDYLHARMQAMVEMLAAAIDRAGSADALPVARALEGARLDPRALGGAHQGVMRAEDHQFLQPVYVSVMDRAGPGGLKFDVEGSGYAFRSVRRFAPDELGALSGRCRMVRPG